MIFRQLFDRETSTYTYLLGDTDSGLALLIDPVLHNADRDLSILDELGLTLHTVLETHVHADHITAAWTLKQRTGCRIVVPEGSGASGADHEIGHRETLEVGAVRLQARATPGHTSGSASYVLCDHSKVFTGDTLLIRGCGRTDFQEGDAATLYRSVHEQLFTLPDACEVYPGHDYKGRTMSTIAEEKAYNPRLGGGRSVEAFVALMNDLGLPYPAQIDRALPANLQVGRPPALWDGLQRAPSGALQVSPAWVDAHAGEVRLVDVRGEDEFTGPLGHLDGAACVPLHTLPEAASAWDRDQPIVAICRSGGRSDRAAVMLERAGFAKVASMTGGMLAVRGGVAACAG